MSGEQKNTQQNRFSVEVMMYAKITTNVNSKESRSRRLLQKQQYQFPDVRTYSITLSTTFLTGQIVSLTSLSYQIVNVLNHRRVAIQCFDYWYPGTQTRQLDSEKESRGMPRPWWDVTSMTAPRRPDRPSTEPPDGPSWVPVAWA